MIKQVIVVRKDLNCRRGKWMAQSAHASMAVLLQSINLEEGTHTLHQNPSIKEWLQGRFTKIVVSVDSEEELLLIHQKALEAGIPCSLIQDCGATEFHGVPTYTCCAIGPDEEEKIDLITRGLKLL